MGRLATLPLYSRAERPRRGETKQACDDGFACLIAVTKKKSFRPPVGAERDQGAPSALGTSLVCMLLSPDRTFFYSIFLFSFLFFY